LSRTNISGGGSGLSIVRTRIVAALVLLSLLAAGSYLYCSGYWGPSYSDSLGQARLHVSEPVRDLGHTSFENTLEEVFLIHNHGNRRLVVNELDQQCDCEDRVIRTVLISPGETARVVLTIDPRFASGPTETVAIFTTNDPVQPRFSLSVSAHVDAPDSPDPSRTEVPTAVSILIRQ